MPVNQHAVAKLIQLGDVTLPLSASVTNLGESAEWKNMQPEFVECKLLSAPNSKD